MPSGTLPGILLFIVKTKWQNTRAMNGLQWAAFPVVLLLCLFNAVALSELLTSVSTNPQAVNIIIGSVNVFIGALAFLKDFFPVYRSPAMVPESFYPLHGMERAAAGVIHDLISRYFIALSLFLLLFWLISAEYTFLHLVNSFCIAILAYITGRNMRILLEFDIRTKALYVFLSAILVIGMVSLLASVYFTPSPPHLLKTAGIPGFTVLAFIHHLGMSGLSWKRPHKGLLDIPGRVLQKMSRRFTRYYYPLYAYFAARSVRNMLLMAFAAKTLVILLAIFLRITDGAGSATTGFMILLAASPLVLFTYLFNNIFGHQRELWQTISMSDGVLCAGFTQYILLLHVPLIMDAIYTFTLLTIANITEIALIAFYVVTAAVLIPIGFLASLHRPVQIPGSSTVTTIFTKTTNSFTVYLSLPLTLLYCILILHNPTVFYLVVPIITLSVWSLLLYIRKRLSHARHAVRVKDRIYAVLSQE